MNIFRYAKRHVVITSAAAVIVVATTVVAGRVASRGGTADQAPQGARQVALIDASAFRKDASTIVANGTVESVAQVDLRSQTSAPVAYVNLAVGDSVGAGQVIMELKNADIRARLDQARAALALAQGQYQTGATSLGSARTTAADQVRNAYTAVDQAVRGQLDQFLFNTSGGQMPLSSRVSDLKLLDTLHALRDDLSNYLADWKVEVDGISASSTDQDLFAVLAEAKTVLAATSSLLDSVSIALNSISNNASAADATTISSWKATVASAKGAISGSSSAVTGADTALRASLSSQGTTAEAGISSAQAGVKSLEAELAKTVILSPLSGKIAALPLRVGELASPGTLLATVVGGQGLQIKAYASGEDLSRIARGAAVIIQGGVKGSVSAVAPSVNQTNKKAEVTIAVDDPAHSALVVGQSVSVSIKASATTGSMAGAGNASSSASYFLPIQDIKIVPGDAYVFTVDADSKAVQHSVTLGAVQGDFVEVKAGMTDDMRIVSPVYELEDGQLVDVRS